MRVLLIEGLSLILKAYYSLPSIPGRRGERENVAIFFTRTLLKLLQEWKPEYVGVVFEEPAPSERIKPGFTYTAPHPRIPPSLKKEIEKIHKLLSAMRIKILEEKGYSAGDIIATLISSPEGEGGEFILVSSEKALLQLLGKRVRIVNPFQKFRVIEESELRKKGLEPEKIPSYLALVGDEYLGIPGIEGIGEKRAGEILKDIKNFRQFTRLSPVWREKLKSKEGTLRLSEKIATLNPRVPLSCTLSSLRWEGWEREEVKDAFRELGMSELLVKILEWKEEGREKYLTILREEEWEKFLKELKKAKIVSLDTETTSPNPHDTELVGITFSFSPETAYYLPLRHSYLGVPPQLPEERVIQELKEILEAKPVMGQNIKFDYIVLKRKGLELKNIVFDTMIAAHLLSPGGELYNLRVLSMKYLGRRKKSFPELVEKGRSIAQVPVEEVTRYTCEDVDFALQLKEVLERELERQGLKKLFEKVEMPLLKILGDMEIHGIKIDRDYLEDLIYQAEEEIKVISQNIYSLAGEIFNLNSPRQVARILFQKLSLTPRRRIKTGYSTSWEVLEELKDAHEIVPYLLRVRNIQKILKGFLKPLHASIHPLTGRIHTSFHQVATSTGRLSSSHPNLQNIPVRGEWGERVRKVFVPEEGFLFLSADYSQIELRVLAHLSEDRVLISSFQKGEDIHTSTATRIFSVKAEEVTPDMRRKAKIVNFGIIYGISPRGLARQINSTPEEAENLIQEYFRHHPGVKGFIEKTLESAHTRGYVETFLGRKRYFPHINSDNRFLREAQEREAINAPVQGSAAEIVKLAMIKLVREMEKRDYRSRLLLQVHDEILLEVPREEIEEMEKLVRDILENVVSLQVPLKVEIGKGKNWWEAHQ